MNFEGSSESDTALARLLHARRALELRVLQRLLNEVRAQREAGEHSSLASSLVANGTLSSELVQRYVNELNGPAPPAPAPVSWRPGSRIRDYVLVERLGQGAMGQVFLAEHVPSGRRFALKMLKLAAEPELLLRFEREGRAQAAVRGHPNVVRVHTAGRTEDSLYLVMDLASGGDLDTRLRQGPFAPQEAARLALSLAEGLAHVHAQGVLHRDLKPANVLFDGDGTPMLVDFGLARLQGATTLTQTGDILGTPTCMAPEQARSLHAQIDARTDVYGLGAVLYHALAARAPFLGATTVEVLSKVVLEEPEPPSRHAPEVPPELDAICLRALAKEQDARYPTAEAMAAALRGFLREDGHDPASPAGSGSRTRILAVLALLALCSLGLGGWALSRSVLDPQPTPVPSPSATPATPTPPPTPLPFPTSWFSPSHPGPIRSVFSVQTEVLTPGSAKPSESRFLMDLRWEVAATDSRSITFQVSLERARYRVEVAGMPNEFDSDRSEDPNHPVNQFLGQSVRAKMDPTTGEIHSLAGPEQPAGLQNELNLIFYVGPPLDHDPATPWVRGEWRLMGPRGDVPGILESLPREFMPIRPATAPDAYRRQDGIPLSFEAQVLEGGRVRVRWEGKDKAGHYAQAGEAELQGGFLVTAESRRTWHGPGTQVRTTINRYAIKTP